MFNPVEIDPRDRPLMEKVGRLRVRAWSTAIPDAAARADCWLDDFELAARHWCVFQDGDPVAAARLSVHDRVEDVPDAEVFAGVFPDPLPAPIASFNRLVVHPAFRGRGLGTLLDAVRVAAAEAMGCGCGIGDTPSGPRRVDQLKAVGFVPVGPLRSLPPHPLFGGQQTQVIYLPLPRRPG